MRRLRAILNTIRLVEPDAELASAQVKVFARQAPVLFVTLGANGVAVAYSHYGIAPIWLTVVPAAVLVCFCIVRSFTWLTILRAPPEGEAAIDQVATISALAIVQAILFPLWGFALMRYGDLGTQMHVVYFLSIALVVCLNSLAQLRSTSILIGLITLPIIISLCLTSEGIVLQMLLSYAASVGAILTIHWLSHGDFRQLVGLLRENHVLAHTDALTGLPNRRSFFSKLEETIELCATNGTSFTVGLIDLDGFKPVNDGFGHHAGDEVLREVANRLENIMEGIGSAARLGGDEFGLVIENERGLEMLGRAICASLQMPYALRDATVQIGASVGFARYPDAAASAEMLVERADYALYFAKDAHRGTAICFAPEHEARLRSHAIVEQALRGADLESEFHLVFQPIIDVVESRIDAYEALARWTSPTIGPISPAEFIVVAERSGLIIDLTQVLLRKALVAMAQWPESVRLSFNLSAHDIASAEGLFRITDLVLESGIDPCRIIFEVTETGLMRDLSDAREALQELKALGVRIALDDFGTGYSSLSYVHQLPIDKLKIDRSFVTHVTEVGAALNVIRALIDLSRNLGYACVVEGVETVEQMLMLRSAGCRYMQGYLFKKPMPQAEIDEYHRQPLTIGTRQFELKAVDTPAGGERTASAA